MPTETEISPAISVSNLPALGQALEGGTFAGLITLPTGEHRAVVLLPDQGSQLTWKDAMAWAQERGGQLPTRPVAALLFANLKAGLRPAWHWTCEEDKDDDEEDASFAWYCGFSDGYQSCFHKSVEGSAVAVRMIHLSA